MASKLLDSFKKSINMAASANAPIAQKEIVKTEQPKQELKAEPKNFVENSNEGIAKAKEGDFIKRQDGTEVALSKGDINYAKQYLESQNVPTEGKDDTQMGQEASTIYIAQNATPEMQNADGEAGLADAMDTMTSDIVAQNSTLNSDGTISPMIPLDEKAFAERFGETSEGLKTEVDAEGNVKLQSGQQNMSAPTQFEKGRLQNNPYAEETANQKSLYEKANKDADFAKKLTMFSAFANMFSGGKIPFTDFNKLMVGEAYQRYSDMLDKMASYQQGTETDVESSVRNRENIAGNLMQGKQAQETALKTIDANVEADLKRYNAQTLGQLDVIKAQGDVQAKLAKLSHLLQTQEMGDMIDDLRSRGYDEKSIAHWIMATKLGISPGQQAYQNVMNGVKAGADVIGSIMKVVP